MIKPEEMQKMAAEIVVRFKEQRRLSKELYENSERLAVLLKPIRRYFEVREWKILEARTVQRKTLEEIGKEYGVTRERIRQIEEKILFELSNISGEQL